MHSTSRAFHSSCPIIALILALLAAVLILTPVGPANAQDPCGPLSNPIPCENSKAGNPASEWDISGAGDAGIQGFATDISVNRGQAVQFKVDTDATSYRLDIYRMGFYGGLGGRRVATILPSAALPQNQPPCLTDSTSGLVDCGNWAVSASWDVPADAVPGIYFAKLVRQSGGAGSSHIVFVVRNDASTADILFQTSDTTWQAYNRYGGNSLYVGGPGTNPGRAYKVSYNRPFTTRDCCSEDWVFNAEYPMVRWLEANGYNVAYSTGVDTDRRGALLTNHRIFMSVGHDEYWSAAQRSNVEAARNAGINLGFFSGNEIFWKIRWENAIDGSGTAYRTMVSYKETHANAKIDPLPGVWTGTWRDPRFSPPADGGRPENELTGTLFTVNDSGTPYSIQVPEPFGKLRFWRNTAIATLAPGQVATLPLGTLGYEWDEDVDNGVRPLGLIRLSSTTLDVPSKLQDFGSTYGGGTATHSLTLYRHSSGALVFGAGTIQWPWGLDGDHDRGTSTPDVRMQQATVNLLADMSVQPATIQPGLVPAAASADTTRPTSQITSPSPGASLVAGVPVTVTGTASDIGGIVATVEVSVDGGATWHLATGTSNWSFSFTPTALGTVTIRSVALDDSGNVETPGASVTVTVGSTRPCPCSIWSGSTTPAFVTDGDPNPVELGVKFRSDLNGFITGLRFYKSPGSASPHTIRLWTASGGLLTTVTATDETASGWQQVDLASPVPISANTTYVVSYHTVGYAADQGYFAAGPFVNPPLRALGDGEDGLNGVYLYGAGGFPTQSYNSSNYWVDVVFSTTVTADTTPPTLQTVSPGNGTTDVNPAANATASFSEAMDPATVNGSTFELRGPSGTVVAATVTYDVATRSAVLDPTAFLAMGTTYTLTVRGGASGVKDLAGNALAANFSWSFTTRSCPCTIWNNSDTPVLIADSDPNPVELGLKFRSDVGGFITGLRFYKAPGSSGPHVARLWSATGSLLATVTFTNETASGWQQIDLASAVPISAGTSYVASYHTTGYAADQAYFAASAFLSPPLRALRDGEDGLNGLYLYGAGGFPTQSYNSSNYWVDVVFVTALAPDATAPIVTTVTPPGGATGINAAANVTAAFSEAMAPATVNASTFELRGPSGTLVAATVTYDVATGTATLDPTAALAMGTTYTATVRGGASGVKDLTGNALASDFAWSFTTRACPCTIWDNSATPALIADSDPNPVELGVKFRPDVDGFITGLRFYKSPGSTGPHVATLWSSTGALLGSVTFTNETAAGWQQASLSQAVAVTAGVTYIASYHTTGYAADSGYFSGSAILNPPLQALRDGEDGFNGLFLYGSGGFPTQSHNSSNYWVDVVFDTVAPPDNTLPTIAGVTPPNGATGLDPEVNVVVTFSEPMDAGTITTSTIELRNEAGVLVAATVSYNAVSRTATLDPAAALAGGAFFTATVRGGVAGVKDQAGNALASDISWTFRTFGCPCSLWDDSTVPAIVSDPENVPIEVGVKFRSTVDGFITGLRFYKAPANAGPHVGNLWTSGGILLGSVTFTGETASGWQQANFNTPVGISADVTYVASYHAPVGRYSLTESYFTGGALSNPPLRALAAGEDGGNGVYRHGVSGFPVATFNGNNYWVDVVFSTTATVPPDTTPPTVAVVAPRNGNVDVASSANVTATFSEAVNPATITGSTFELRTASGALVPAAVTYNSGTRMAILDPTDPLVTSSTYTARVRGGAAGVKDIAGNAMAADVTWSFSTGALAPPSPDQGPGGPVLVITASANPFTHYYAEILRAEGLNAFAVADLSTVTATALNAYDVVILGEVPLTTAQATMFTDWVNGGGNLIAMRPDKKLAGLLGLTDNASTLSNSYVLVNTSVAPGAGIVSQTMQFHGPADRYTLTGATAVATLYSDATAPTTSPAVTLRSVGGLGGEAAAFTYDLARSIVYTRQGNPAWVGQERDGIAPMRSDDMFFGAAAGDPQPDWIDLNKVAIPQADEQQRLLANLITHVNRDRKPLPRFWYFPRNLKAAVVMTGDDHAGGGTGGRWDHYTAQSPIGCSVEDWECIRGTSYIYPTTAISDGEADYYQANGFELAVHITTNCADYTPATLPGFYSNQLSDFATRFPSVLAPATNRTHCIAWSDWATQPHVSLAHGIRLDTNYYYYPPAWIADRPGFMTGSGMLMRFADLDGTMVDVYQAPTQMTDESGQTYPFTIDTLLDRALGPEGYYGFFTANMHTDNAIIAQDNAIVASSLARNVPVITARQALAWTDGRNGSSFPSLVWSGNRLTFSIAIGQGANGLQVMLPTSAGVGSLSSLTIDGTPVSFTTQTIKGVQYAVFPASLGTYEATYAGP